MCVRTHRFLIGNLPKFGIFNVRMMDIRILYLKNMEMDGRIRLVKKHGWTQTLKLDIRGQL